VNYTGKTRFSLAIVAPAELEAEGDRILKRHAEWVAKTHHREGEKALLQYDVAKGENDDGSITYLLTEVYESAAGVQDHNEQAANWDTIGDLMAWLRQCQVIGGGSSIIHSLW
jgi:quinol monooxygenase YgiN